MKKSLAELQAIREKTLDKINNRTGNQDYRVVVGMATCGIAAGARPVLTRFMDLVEEKKLTDVSVSQTGCVGLCRVEPIVEIYDKNNEKTTYINMTPEKVDRIVEEHLMGGKVITEYTITMIDSTLVSPKEISE